MNKKRCRGMGVQTFWSLFLEVQDYIIRGKAIVKIIQNDRQTHIKEIGSAFLSTMRTTNDRGLWNS